MLTYFQKLCMCALKESCNGISCSLNVALRLKSHHIAVTSAMRSLERGGLVCRLAPKDRWTSAKWALTSKGEKVTEEIKAKLLSSGMYFD